MAPVQTELPDRGRRRILAVALGSFAYARSLIPWALAAPVSAGVDESFLALSAILVGRVALDTGLGDRLHAALAGSSSQFDTDAHALLQLIEDQHILPAVLQSTLDASHSPLAALPRAIMRAWCLGLVGQDEAVRCIAYEEALDAVIVADMLKPPTYAYGPYGSWSKPPVSGKSP